MMMNVLSLTLLQVSNTCLSCGVQFGKYFCHVCNYYDNEDKGQYHCDGCGICR